MKQQNSGIQLICAVLLAILPFGSWTQDKEIVDKNFSFSEYLETVRLHHPMFMRADLVLDKGDAQVLSSRGAFDPVVYAEITQKYFKGKQYYSLLDGGIKIPTWFGVELYAGYEQNRGENANPQYRTPDAGLAYAGVSVPILQGLLMDKRRATLRKAQISLKMSEQEVNLIKNDVLQEAMIAYWQWYTAYNVMEIYRDALQVAEERYVGVKQSARLGDIPAIDTLEAGIQVQNRMFSLQQAELEYANAKALLSLHLWQQGSIPLELGEGVIPPVGEMSVGELPFLAPPLDWETQLIDHPELNKAQLKIDQLQLDRRIALELVKPELNLKYNALNEPISSNPFAEYSLSNYKWGADFSIPILLREGRGELKLANLHIQDANLGLEQKKAQLSIKVQQANNEWRTTNQQLELYRQTYRDIERLLQGEQTKFSRGESSLFLVNSREMNYISARVKLVELYAKNMLALIKTYHSLGLLK